MRSIFILRVSEVLMYFYQPFSPTLLALNTELYKIFFYLTVIIYTRIAGSFSIARQLVLTLVLTVRQITGLY